MTEHEKFDIFNSEVGFASLFECRKTILCKQSPVRDTL